VYKGVPWWVSLGCAECVPWWVSLRIASQDPKDCSRDPKNSLSGP